ncbi:MAG: hypothetical protein CM15mV13_3430 [uncultured marine virus]|nr:MAG: hypothetical protein CM15mV13_3430 [uncultured marine virus]
MGAKKVFYRKHIVPSSDELEKIQNGGEIGAGGYASKYVPYCRFFLQPCPYVSSERGKKYGFLPHKYFKSKNCSSTLLMTIEGDVWVK